MTGPFFDTSARRVESGRGAGCHLAPDEGVWFKVQVRANGNSGVPGYVCSNAMRILFPVVGVFHDGKFEVRGAKSSEGLRQEMQSRR